MGMGLFMEQRRGKMLLVPWKQCWISSLKTCVGSYQRVGCFFQPALKPLLLTTIRSMTLDLAKKRVRRQETNSKFGEKDFQLGCRRLISSTRFNWVLFMKIGNPSKASRAVLHRACSTCLLGTFSGMWYNWLHVFTLSQMGFWKRL